MPEPLIGLIRQLVGPGTEVSSVAVKSWKGKKDVPLIRDVAEKGYDVFLTGDMRQLDDPKETRAIHDAGIHHVRYKTIDGLDGLGEMCGAISAMIRPILGDLESAPAQRLVLLTPRFGRTSWYMVCDPRDARQGPRYWPR